MRLFLTLAGACLLVAFSVAALSRRAARQVIWGPGVGEPTLELHRLDAGEEPSGDLELHASAQHGFDRSLLLALGAVVGAALVGTALLSIWIVRPVERLTRAAANMPGGRVPQEGRGEVAQLGATLNELASGLERTEQLRRRLLHDVGHELRTPLNALRGRIEALQDGLLQADAENLGALHANVIYLGRIVEDLQELSLAEAGELRLESGPVDLEAAIDELLLLVEYTRVESEVGKLPALFADRSRLRQVLTNLLDNAVAHTPAPGRVRITARETPGALEVTIHDEGPGIEAADLPHIFERFYRGDPSRERSKGGAGLGLSIVRQLVQAQGGEIGVESEPGEGTTFRFSLPTA